MEEFKKLLELKRRAVKECSWCRVQTIKDMSEELVSEAHEVAKAIEQNDAHELEEELGDLMWDLLFITLLAEEKGLFTLNSVLDKAFIKFKERQPHLFDDNTTNDIKLIHKLWKDAKKIQKEKKVGREHKKIFDYDLPTRNECYEIFEKYKTPKHVIKHCEAVNRVAVLVASLLKDKGIEIDIPLVDKCSLLHDALRYVDFKEMDYSKFDEDVLDQTKQLYEEVRNRFKDKDHGQAIAEIMKDYPKMKTIFHKHHFWEIRNGLNTWEEKVVHYADKRVIHDKFATMKERFEDGNKRYGNDSNHKNSEDNSSNNNDSKHYVNNEHQKNSGFAKGYNTQEDLDEVYRLEFELEKEIFNNLDIEPDDLLKILI